jgi:hypothetical protein
MAEIEVTPPKTAGASFNKPTDLTYSVGEGSRHPDFDPDLAKKQ